MDLNDIVVILNYLFLAGPAVCFDAADVDATGVLDLTDPITIINYMFLAGPPPAPPFPDCGPAQTPADCTGAGCP
jgi:hypothetical protein